MTKKGVKRVGNSRYLLNGASPDIRTKVRNYNGTITNSTVRLNRQLDIQHKDGSYFCINPKTKRRTHLGLTRLRTGEYVLITEELVGGKPRKFSKRDAFMVTAEEALTYIYLSDRLDLLESDKYAELKWLFNARPDEIMYNSEVIDLVQKG